MAFSDVAELRLVGTLQGQRCINVFHFATETVINDPQELNTLLLQLANAMLECAVTTLLPAVTSNYKLLRVDARSIKDPDHPEVSVQPEGTNEGELSVTSTSFLATLLNHKTGGGGKRGRGKTFLPPVGELQMSDGSIDNGTLPLVIAFVTCVFGKFVGASKTTDWFFGVWSKKAFTSAGGSFDTAFRKVTTTTVNTTVAKMGSRKKGIGA